MQILYNFSSFNKISLFLNKKNVTITQTVIFFKTFRYKTPKCQKRKSIEFLLAKVTNFMKNVEV